MNFPNSAQFFYPIGNTDSGRAFSETNAAENTWTEMTFTDGLRTMVNHESTLTFEQHNQNQSLKSNTSFTSESNSGLNIENHQLPSSYHVLSDESRTLPSFEPQVAYYNNDINNNPYNVLPQAAQPAAQPAEQSSIPVYSTEMPVSNQITNQHLAADLSHYYLTAGNSVTTGLLNELPPIKKETRKSFECSRCRKSYSLQKHLKRHAAIHAAVAPFPCCICFKRFNRADTYKRHLRRCHEKFAQNNKTKSSSSPPYSSLEGCLNVSSSPINDFQMGSSSASSELSERSDHYSCSTDRYSENPYFPDTPQVGLEELVGLMNGSQQSTFSTGGESSAPQTFEFDPGYYSLHRDTGLGIYLPQ